MKTLHLAITTIFLIVFLFHCNTILAQNETQPRMEFDHAGYFTKKMNCNFYNTGKISPQDQEQIKATITVTDSIENKFSTSIDRITVYVWSDSDKKGVLIAAYETEVNSGIFKGLVTISEGQSTQDKIHVGDGDTLYAKYPSTTPWSITSSNQGIITTAFIGVSCHPFERVPASPIRVLDNRGSESNIIKVGHQVMVTSDITNPTRINQNFTYIVQIQGKNGSTESLAWLSGEIYPNQSFSPGVSWTPRNVGNYVATVFVWQSLNNPNALSTPRSADVVVLHDFVDYKNSTIKNIENLHCKLGYELVMKSSNHSPACVTPSTATKLVKLGWAKDEQEFSEKEAISLIKRQHPELQDFPSDNLPPKIIRSEKSSNGWYVMFETQGSGRPIIGAKCFLVDNAKTVSQIGEYTPKLEDTKINISVKTCH